jgi:glycosyltransferase involved in cell wall biosynthesis
MCASAIRDSIENAAEVNRSAASLKALQIVFSLDVGGIERFVINLTQAFRSCAIDSIVFFTSHEGKLASQLPSNIKTYIGGSQTGDKILDWQTLRKVVRCVKEQNVQVIHSHSRKAYIYGSLASILAGRPHITSVHSLEPMPFRRKIFEQTLLRQASRVISVSSDVTDRLQVERNISCDKIVTIKNGIDTDLFHSVEFDEKASIRRELGLPADGFIIGTVGRVVRVKNYPLLVSAFSRFASVAGNACLVIVGDGDRAQEIAALVHQLKLDDRVVLAGAKTNTLKWYQAFDVFALSSLSEGTPMVLLEAGACGLPCLVTNVGGNIEVVKNQTNGIVVESENVESMYGGLKQLYENPSLIAHMKAEARLNIQNNYSMTACGREHRRIYMACMKTAAYA